MPHNHPLCTRNHRKHPLKRLTIAIPFILIRIPPQPHQRIPPFPNLLRQPLCLPLDPIPHLLIDPLKPILHMVHQQPSMYKHIVSHHKHRHILPQEPPTDHPIRPQRCHPRPKPLPILLPNPSKPLLHPLKQALPLPLILTRQSVAQSLHLLPNLIPKPPIPKLLDPLLGHIPEIPAHIHDLMIPIHGNHTPPNTHRLSLQSLHEIHYLDLVSMKAGRAAQVGFSPDVGGIFGVAWRFPAGGGGGEATRKLEEKRIVVYDN
ncbi:hypothetical protein AKJ16_DCAP04599 [Drosera capensis]